MFRKEVIKALIDEGFCVTISAPPRKSKMSDYFKDIGCHVENIQIDRRGTNPLKDLIQIWHYLQLIRKVKPLAVLTYTIKPNVYGGIISRLYRVPQIANITGLGSAIENSGWLRPFAIMMYRFGLKSSRKVFCQNLLILDFCNEKNIGRDKLLIPGSGVNLKWHTLQEYPPENTRMRFNFIGRIMKDKGVEEYLEMAKTIHAKYPQTEFHVIGRCEQPYENHLKQLQAEGIIIWDGSVADVRPHIKDSWCTVHPSYHEGMANVVLETCAAGRPVIASDINGCKEAVDNSVSGYLCKAKDTADLIAKVEQFILLPYEKKAEMGKAARRKMEREFDRNMVIRAYMDELKSIKHEKNHRL